MKPVSLLTFILLLAIVACGKDNKSGKNNNPYFNALGTYNAYSGSGFAYNGYSVNQVVNENPCIGGYPNTARMSGSIQVQVNTVIPNGDFYVGVTSYGDVAVIGGNGSTNIMQYYLCPRSMMSQPSQAAYNVSLFPYTNCGFKQMNATLRLADGTVANFRMMDYGNSAGARFTYCR